MNSSSSDENFKELLSVNNKIEILEKELVELKRKKSYFEERMTKTEGAFRSYQQPEVKSTKIIKMVEGKLSVNAVENYAKLSAEKNSKGGFLGKGKIIEKALGWQKFLYPYYDVEMEVTIKDMEKRGWFKKEEVTKTLKSRTSLDGITGAIADVNENGISYRYAFLKDLSWDELNLLYYVSNLKSFTIKELRGLSQTEAKSRKLADGLAANGILQRTDSRPAQFFIKYPYPNNPASFVSLMEKYNIVESSVNDKIMDPKIGASSLSSYLERYWNRCDVLSSEVVYYPYYGIAFERENNVRSEIIDGITGTRQEYLERFISVKAENKIS